MAAVTRAHLLMVIRYAYGPAMATFLARRLPERLDLDDDEDAELLVRLGLARDRLCNALGAEW